MTRRAFAAAATLSATVLLASGVRPTSETPTSPVRLTATSGASVGDDPLAVRDPGVLLPGPGGPSPTATVLSTVVAPALRDPRLGPAPGAEVIDAESGAVLLSRAATSARTPASTTKLLTATAALATLGPDFRFTTTVVAAPDNAVAIVGGGDPTLTAFPSAPSYPGAASIGQLAAALHQAGVAAPSAILVDGSRFAGPRLGPGWDSDDVSGGDVAPITALTVDGGRRTAGQKARSAAPDLSAGTDLAAALGLPKTPVRAGRAAAGAKVLAHVRSAPVSRLVDQMLTVSDNVIAEYLAHQVGLATGQPASFAGGAAATRAALARLGVPLGGDTLVDGSGLSRLDALSPATLTAVLRADVTHPTLRPILADLPVAGYTGTLASRYLTGPAHRAAGMTRAKTGSLSGVSTLAGLVTDADGRPLVFALMAGGAAGSAAADPTAGTAGADPTSTEPALDRVAGILAGCGCR